MQPLFKFSLAALLSVFVVNSYAIQVNVSSTNSNIDGLGFTVNGEKHGGPGTTYEGRDMPQGSYAFGLREKGKDVPCYSKGGKRTVNLNKDTNAVLHFNGRHCNVTLGAQ